MKATIILIVLLRAAMTVLSADDEPCGLTRR